MTVRVVPLLVITLAACSASPYEPINQSGPIRAMDRFFSGGAIDAYTPPAGVRPQRQTEIWVKQTPPQAPEPDRPSVAHVSNTPTSLTPPSPTGNPVQ